jgi:acetoin utilization protein AcuB
MAEALAAFLHVRHLPVVSLSQRIIGIISIRDILAHYVESEGDESIRLRDFMTKDPITCNADAPLAEVAALMEKNNVSCIPIIDDAEEIIGIITERDFVRVFSMVSN